MVIHFEFRWGRRAKIAFIEDAHFAFCSFYARNLIVYRGFDFFDVVPFSPNVACAGGFLLSLYSNYPGNPRLLVVSLGT